MDDIERDEKELIEKHGLLITREENPLMWGVLTDMGIESPFLKPRETGEGQS